MLHLGYRVNNETNFHFILHKVVPQNIGIDIRAAKMVTTRLLPDKRAENKNDVANR